MESLSALQMSATALGVASAIFHVRLMFLAGTDYEDLVEVLGNELKQETKRAIPLGATVLSLALMSFFQFATWVLSSWVYPLWDLALHLVPVSAWLGFFAGWRMLALHRRYLDGFELIERGWLIALVCVNFLLSVAITYFYLTVD